MKKKKVFLEPVSNSPSDAAPTRRSEVWYYGKSRASDFPFEDQLQVTWSILSTKKNKEESQIPLLPLHNMH